MPSSHNSGPMKRSSVITTTPNLVVEGTNSRKGLPSVATNRVDSGYIRGISGDPRRSHLEALTIGKSFKDMSEKRLFSAPLVRVPLIETVDVSKRARTTSGKTMRPRSVFGSLKDSQSGGILPLINKNIFPHNADYTKSLISLNNPLIYKLNEGKDLPQLDLLVSSNLLHQGHELKKKSKSAMKSVLVQPAPPPPNSLAHKSYNFATFFNTTPDSDANNLLFTDSSKFTSLSTQYSQIILNQATKDPWPRARKINITRFTSFPVCYGSAIRTTDAFIWFIRTLDQPCSVFEKIVETIERLCIRKFFDIELVDWADVDMEVCRKLMKEIVFRKVTIDDLIGCLTNIEV
ncbi:hypothetical protein HK096_010432 [Nowakowskiella sp. JEL0078]|nr:hypothetical protein HK096_010432 [Nowakowskiella sp. JEL0078]